MKIVLDTNCLLIAVPKRSDYHCLLIAVPKRSDYHCILSDLNKGRYTLCCSNDILMEYEEMLLRFYLQIACNILNFIFYSLNLSLVMPYYKWNLITSDPDDNKFADCALNAGADYIVTNDRHFNVLKALDFPTIKIINIDTFKNILML
jgi:predicted nucleic acid-binding protein